MKKKLLSIVLCLCLAFALLPFASLAKSDSTVVFTDQDSIQNEEAVVMCSALNIIDSYEDGSFKPNGTITRAEACKMICVADNGGSLPTYNSNVSATFADISEDWCRWAEPCIESCAARGIVSGVGDGTFRPAGKLTGSQFAKMLLVELGYNAEVQNYNGDLWEVNVNTDACNRDLYDGLSIDPSQPLTRDNAAQMMWNALNSYEVEYVEYKTGSNAKVVLQDKVIGSNNEKITLLEDKYGDFDVDSIIAE